MAEFAYEIVGDTTDPRTPGPTVTIMLKRSKDDVILLSARCLTEGEIDGVVESLIRELENVGINAKSALRRCNKKGQ